MLNKIKKSIQIGLAGIVLSLSFAAAANAQGAGGAGGGGQTQNGGAATGAGEANIQGSTCQGSQLQFSASGATTDCKANVGGSESTINNIIANIINIFSVVVGIVAVIMIIAGGFRYITSGGDTGKVTQAKNTILYAIIGLVVVAFAQFIVKFVLAKATGN